MSPPWWHKKYVEEDGALVLELHVLDVLERDTLVGVVVDLGGARVRVVSPTLFPG